MVYLFCPHLGQNLTDIGSCEPQRLHTAEPPSCLPQLQQNVAPGCIGALHSGHVAPEAAPLIRGEPQLMHLRAFSALSVPHLGQGL